MIDPLGPLFQVRGQAVASVMPNAADPRSALAVMIVGIVILVVTGFWAVGGLGAAVWLRFHGRRTRRFHGAGGSPKVR